MHTNIEMQSAAFRGHHEAVASPMVIGSVKDADPNGMEHVQSLTIVSRRDGEKTTLMDCAAKSKQLWAFLTITGGNWPQSDGCFMEKTAFAANRLGIMYFAAYWIVGGITGIMYSTAGHSKAIFYLLLSVAKVLMIVVALAVLPVQYSNVRRLCIPTEAEDFLVVEESVRMSAIYGCASVTLSVAGAVLLCIPPPDSALEWSTAFANLFVVMALAFNLFFLLVDVKVSSLLVDQLHILADRKLLTMQKFSSVREEVNKRVTASRLASDFVIIPALLSVVIIVLTIYMTDRAVARRSLDDDAENWINPVLRYTGVALMQLKEVLFLLVAFSYVARVNARADELTLKLSKGFWGRYADADAGASGAGDNSAFFAGPKLPESVELCDLHRVSMYMSAQCEPISFTLAFCRVSWRGVAVGVAGFAVSVLVGVIKSILASAVTA